MGGLVTPAFFLPSLEKLVRRRHGVGCSGWWFLIVFTVIGIVVLLYRLVKGSDAGAGIPLLTVPDPEFVLPPNRV